MDGDDVSARPCDLQLTKLNPGIDRPFVKVESLVTVRRVIGLDGVVGPLKNEGFEIGTTTDEGEWEIASLINYELSHKRGTEGFQEGSSVFVAEI